MSKKTIGQFENDLGSRGIRKGIRNAYSIDNRSVVYKKFANNILESDGNQKDKISMKKDFVNAYEKLLIQVKSESREKSVALSSTGSLSDVGYVVFYDSSAQEQEKQSGGFFGHKTKCVSIPKHNVSIVRKKIEK